MTVCRALGSSGGTLIDVVASVGLPREAGNAGALEAALYIVADAVRSAVVGANRTLVYVYAAYAIPEISLGTIGPCAKTDGIESLRRAGLHAAATVGAIASLGLVRHAVRHFFLTGGTSRGHRCGEDRYKCCVSQRVVHD